jgi:hypothetical protein
MISQNIALLKQLKCNGLNESILVSVFKSLVLSHLRYSSTLLVACPAGIKSDMQVLQNTLLRTIGIKRDVAKSKYGILDVSEFIYKTSLEQVTRILTTDGREPSNHPLAVSLRTNSKKSHSPFTIPRCDPNFGRNAVIRTLIHLRDNVYGTGRAISTNHQSQPPAAPPAPAAKLTKPRVHCTNPECKEKERTWIRLDLHLNSCLKKNPPHPTA